MAARGSAANSTPSGLNASGPTDCSASGSSGTAAATRVRGDASPAAIATTPRVATHFSILEYMCQPPGRPYSTRRSMWRDRWGWSGRSDARRRGTGMQAVSHGPDEFVGHDGFLEHARDVERVGRDVGSRDDDDGNLRRVGTGGELLLDGETVEHLQDQIEDHQVGQPVLDDAKRIDAVGCFIDLEAGHSQGE